MADFPQPELTFGNLDTKHPRENLTLPAPAGDKATYFRTILREIEKIHDASDTRRIRYIIESHLNAYAPKAEDTSNDTFVSIGVLPHGSTFTGMLDEDADDFYTVILEYANINGLIIEGVTPKLKQKIEKLQQDTIYNEDDALKLVNKYKSDLVRVYDSCFAGKDYREWVERFKTDYPKVLRIKAPNKNNIDVENAKVLYLQEFVDSMRWMLSSEENMVKFNIAKWFTEDELKDFYEKYGKLQFSETLVNLPDLDKQKMQPFTKYNK